MGLAAVAARVVLVAPAARRSEARAVLACHITVRITAVEAAAGRGAEATTVQAVRAAAERVWRQVLAQAVGRIRVVVVVAAATAPPPLEGQADRAS